MIKVFNKLRSSVSQELDELKLRVLLLFNIRERILLANRSAVVLSFVFEIGVEQVYYLTNIKDALLAILKAVAGLNELK